MVNYMQCCNVYKLLPGAIPHSHAMAVPLVSLAIIKDVTGNFSESNMIGQGGFSIVYKVLQETHDSFICCGIPI